MRVYSDRMSEDQQPRITFSYEKSPTCRTIHASGAWGSVTPEYAIYMALFSEHLPIPERTAHLITETGALGVEVDDERQVKSGVVRQIEAEVFLSEQTAISLVAWLQERLRQIQEARAQVERTRRDN